MRYKALFLITLILISGCQSSNPEPEEVVRPVRALKLKDEVMIETRVFPGRTRAVNRVNLSFRVDGVMIGRPVFVGTEVKKDDVVARLDPKDFEVKLQTAQGNLEKVEAQYRFAQRDYKRATGLWKKDPGAISQSLLDQKEEQVNQLKGELVSLQAQVEGAKDQLSYTYLRSPIDGMVVATYAEPYEYVKAKQSIMRLLDTSQVEMVIDVPENVITEIPYVKDIIVQFDALAGRQFSAAVKEIGTEASATTRTYPVTLLIDQPEDKPVILAGMAGYAKMSGPHTQELSEKGYLLPTTAVFSDVDKSKTYVWVVNPETMRLELKEVEKGSLVERGIMVTEGVKAGEWVVTAGVALLREGQKIKILPVEINPQGEQIELPEDEAIY